VRAGFAKQPIPVLAVALIGGTAIPSLAADSVYTTHDYQACPLVKDEDPYQVRRCEGFGGIAVNWHNEDDDAVVDFGTNGSSEDWPYEQSFVFAGKTIEWRGATRAGGLVPYAAIVRYDMGRSIGGPFDPVLMIFRLEGRENSCLAASVDGRRADANARARRLADGFVRTFRCGKDTRRARE
jgi:hypothetical protein